MPGSLGCCRVLVVFRAPATLHFFRQAVRPPPACLQFQGLERHGLGVRKDRAGRPGFFPRARAKGLGAARTPPSGGACTPGHFDARPSSAQRVWLFFAPQSGSRAAGGPIGHYFRPRGSLRTSKKQKRCGISRPEFVCGLCAAAVNPRFSGHPALGLSSATVAVHPPPSSPEESAFSYP